MFCCPQKSGFQGKTLEACWMGHRASGCRVGWHRIQPCTLQAPCLLPPSSVAKDQGDAVVLLQRTVVEEDHFSFVLDDLLGDFIHQVIDAA